MKTIKSLYIDGLEHHTELVNVNKVLITQGKKLEQCEISGNESLTLAGSEVGALGLTALKEIGFGLFTLAKWVGGATLTGLSKAIGGAGTALTRTFSNNETLIRKLLSNFSNKEEETFKVSEKALKVITIEGSVDDVTKDIDVILSYMGDFEKHSKDVLSFLDKKLLIARKLGKAKSSDDILKVMDEYEKLEYPELKDSPNLPGDKVISLEYKDKAEYLMNSTDVSATAGELTLTKGELNSFLAKLNKVNSYHVKFKSSYDAYLKHLKSWSDMVKITSNNLGDMEGVSGSIMREAEILLEGDRDGLLFYSGFTPRVVNYTDKYIQTVLGVFA